MEISNKDIKYSQDVCDRFVQLCKEGKIFYPDMFKVVNQLNNDFLGVMTISDYSRNIERNYKLVQEDYRNRKLAGDVFGKVDFIFSKFN
jgi:hypothetical protein